MKFKYKEYQDIANGIQGQYTYSNVGELARGILKVFEKHCGNAYNSIILDNFNLPSANGDSLDLWGNILGLSRYIPQDPVGKNYNYFNFNNKQFIQLIFNNPNAPEYGTLDDGAFRDMLLFLLQRQYVFPSPYNLNIFLTSFFDKYGGVYIQDSTDMSYQTVWFNENIPDWLSYILRTNDILPRPAGVGSKFGISYNRFFGFETDDDEFNQNYVGNFFGSNFINFNELER